MSINKFGYQNLPIYKVNYYINKNEFIKYIFIGERDKSIKNILNKLEKGYNNISNSESDILDKEILNFKKIFGDIISEQCKFIYSYISNFTNISNLLLKINYLINKKDKELLPQNQYLWVKYSILDYQIFIDINKYLFGIEKEFNNELVCEREIFIERLTQLLDMTYDEIIDNIILKNKLKYEKKNPTLFDNKVIEFERLYLNEEYRELLLNVDFSLTNNYYNIKNQEKINIYLNNNPFQKKKFMPHSDLNNVDYSLNECLNTNGKILNNNINLVSKKIYKEFFTKNENYYFTNKNNYKVEEINNLGDLINNYVLKLEKKFILDNHKNIVKNCNTSIKKLFFRVNNSDNYEYIDLAKIFQIFKLNRVIPFIRKEYNGDIEIKSYLPFVKQHNINHIMKVLSYSKGIINSNYNNIVFICNIREDLYFRCILFENSQFYVLINFNSYEETDILKGIINLVNLIIKNIKKYSSIKTLNILQINHLLDIKQVNISNNFLEDCTLKFEYFLKDNLDTSNLFNELSDKISIFKNYFSFISNPLKPNLKFLFKGINQFFSKDNILRFINNYSKSKNYNLNKKDKTKLSNILKNIFLLSNEKIDKIIENINYEQLKENPNNMIYAIPINLNIISNKIVITLENVDNFKYVNKILQILNIILFSIYETNLIFENKTTKIENKGKNSKKNINLSDYEMDLNVIDLDDLSDFDDYSLDDIDLQDENFSDIDIDLDDIDEVKKEISKKEKEKIIEDNDILDINIQKKFDKMKKMKYSAYMKKMREDMDKELFDEDKRYGTLCGNDVMRQPFILSDSEIKSIKNPKALTGYIKYRGNNYICPRIFDTKTKQPVSVEDYISNNGLSPYSRGKAIPNNKRGSQVLNDEYTMIIRKPTSSEFWSNPEKEKTWPVELKKTGFDGFPGLSVIGGKNKYCRPCCFKNIPEGYKQNENEVKELENYKGKSECNLKLNNNYNNIDKHLINDRIVCENQKYIVDENSNLDNCRLGLLNKNLDLLLNNFQDIFLTKDKSHLKENSNLFLRRGVYTNKHNNNFLRCIASIKGVSNYENFKFNLVKNITPDLFLNLNNGNLVKIYSSNSILPNSKKQLENFKLFLTENKYLINLIDLENNIIERVNKIKNIKKLSDIKKLIVLYELFTAYTNYIKNILSPDVDIDYTHYLDLISRNNDLIFEEGVSIVIFNKESNNIICNPYFRITNKVVILIKESNYKFTPVYHTIMKNTQMRTFGLINIGVNLKLNNDATKHFSKKYDSNIINYVNDRENKIKTLLLLHNNNCVNTNEIVKTKNDLNEFINENELLIKAQIILNSTEVYYLQLDNNILFPIYPINFTKDYPVKLIENINLPSNIKKILEFYKKISIKNKSYKIKNYLFNNDKVFGFKLSNDLKIPIQSCELDEYIDLFENYNIEPLDDILFDELSFNNKKEDIQTIQLIYQDFIYNNFKFDLSVNLIKKENIKHRDNLIKLLHDRNNYSENIEKIMEIIMNLMANNVPLEKKKEVKLIPGITFTGCNKFTSKKKCNTNPFCIFENQKCKLNIDNKNLELFSYLVSQDLINSNDDRKNILKNNYVFNNILSNRIMSHPDEIISDISNIKKDIMYEKFKKYRKGIPLNEYYNMSKIPKILDNKNISAAISHLNKLNDDNIKNIAENIVNYAIDYILPKNIIIATPFDRDGNINKKMSSGPCIFPYLDTKKLKLKYNCEYNKKNLLTCPVLLNKDKKPQKWGYCPENPIITKKRLDIKNINTVGDKKNYFEGTCKFPYMMNKYNLIYDCHKDIDEKTNNEFSWCPIKLKRGYDTEIPVAADKLENVYDKKWKSNLLYNKNNLIHQDFARVSKKGYCQAPIQKLKLTKKIKKLSFDTYNPNIACNTPSKGGYTKEQLYYFGTEVLKIPNLKLRDENIIFSKEKICDFINNIYFKIKNEYEDKKPGYQKDITKCNRGESYGGYSLYDLRRIANNYYDLDMNEAINMKKNDICDYIIKKINIVKTEKIKENVEIDNYLIDNFDKKNCDKPPNRGGYKSNDLKSLAKSLNITNFKMLNKSDLCTEIERKIKKIKNKSEYKNKNNNKKTKKKIELHRIKTLSKLLNNNNNNNNNNL